MEIKTAVVGCGRMGAQNSSRLAGVVPSGWLPISHAESFLCLDNAKLIAISEKDLEKLNVSQMEYQVNGAFEDYSEMFSKCDIDIVSIATRTPEKENIIRNAITAGVKGIYVEKPLANNLESTIEVLSLAKKHNVFMSYGVNRRFHSTYRKAKELLLSNEFGKLKEVSVGFGESPLLWTHPHAMDLLVYFAGVPKKVRADLQVDSVNQTEEFTVDSDPVIVSAQFEFEDNVRGSINISNGCIVSLYCEKGMITVHGDGAFIQVSKPSSPNSPYFHDQNFLHPQPPQGATVNAFEELKQVITGEMDEATFYELISLDDIFFSQALLFACVWSHLNSNGYVNVEDVPHKLVVTGKSGQYYA